MPIQSCQLPNGGGSGYRWGSTGTCYQNRADAEKQAAAAHANGFTGDNVDTVKNTTVKNTTVKNTKVTGAEETFDSVNGRRIAQDHLVFDRASARFSDKDGRLYVSQNNISKANVCPYKGVEIPEYERIGLDPGKLYQLLRDPKELELAVDTFNGLPLLDIHKPTSAWDHPKGLVVGSTGTDAAWHAPYLTNSIAVWTADAIEGIESGKQQELSAAYHFDADMTPGTYQGVRYDGIMRNIHGNHLALVPKGRAGSDVIVGDSSLSLQHPETKSMAALTKTAALVKGALMARPPKLAQDQKLDYTTLLAGVTAKTFKGQKPAITAAIKPKLAADANLDEVIELLDKCDSEIDPNDDEPVVDTAAEVDPPKRDADDTVLAKLRPLLAEMAKLLTSPAAQPDDKRPVGDEPPAPPVKRTDSENPEPTKKDEKSVDKPAMDAAIASAVSAAEKRAVETTVARLRAVAAAEADVKPMVGTLAIACDSAEQVYTVALKAAGVETNGINEAGLRALVKSLSARREDNRPTIAMDMAGVEDFNKMYPDAARIRVSA